MIMSLYFLFGKKDKVKYNTRFTHKPENSYWLSQCACFWTLAAQALGLPFLSPYLQSIGSDYRHGANYATLASTVLLPNTSLFVTGISPFSLAIQLNQMKEFKAKVDELHRSLDRTGKNHDFISCLTQKKKKIIIKKKMQRNSKIAGK